MSVITADTHCKHRVCYTVRSPFLPVHDAHKIFFWTPRSSTILERVTMPGCLLHWTTIIPGSDPSIRYISLAPSCIMRKGRIVVRVASHNCMFLVQIMSGGSIWRERCDVVLDNASESLLFADVGAWSDEKNAISEHCLLARASTWRKRGMP